MLQSIRDRASGWFAYAIVLLISIPFALWGINHYLDGGGKQVAAQVGSTSISIGRFEEAYRSQQARIAQMFGGQLPSSVSDKMIKQAALRQLIQETVLAQAVQQAGYRITDKELLKEIMSIPAFQDKGHFSRTRYEQVLAEQGMTPHIFEGRLRRELKIEQFQSGIFNTSFVTSKEAEALDSLRNEQRKVEMSIIPLSRFFSGSMPTPEAIKKYYNAHKSDFTAQEKVRVAYLMLNKNALIKQIKPSESDLEQYYNAHKTQYIKPRQAKVSEIVLNISKDKKNQEAVTKLASNLRDQSIKDHDFDLIAKKYSQNNKNSNLGGNLGLVSEKTLPAQLWGALTALKAGDVSKPVTYDSKIYLLRLDKWLPAGQLPYSAVKEQVRTDFTSKQSTSLFDKQSQRLSDLTYAHPGTLLAAAKSLGLHVMTSDWFSKNDGTGLMSNPMIVKAAFSKAVFKNGTNSGVINISKGTAIVLRIADKRPPHPKTLDQVQPQIQGILERKDAEAAAKSLAHQMNADLSAGKSLRAIAASKHLSFRSLGWLGRDDKDIPASIVKAAFGVPLPEKGKVSFGSAKLDNGGYAIFEVSAVKWPKSNNQIDPKLKNDMSSQMARTEMLILFQSLEKSMNIKIYPNNLNL